MSIGVTLPTENQSVASSGSVRWYAGSYWHNEAYIILHDVTGGSFRVSRLVESTDAASLTLSLVGEFWSFSDAIKAAEIDSGLA